MATSRDRGVALVTGASSAVGALYADRLAKRGFDLILVARDPDRCRRQARRLSALTGRDIRLLAADLATRADMRRVEQVLQANGRLSVLVNSPEPNEASDGYDRDGGEEDAAALQALVMTRLAYAAAPGFVARGGGAVINVAALGALAPNPMDAVRPSSKAFMLAFSRALQQELGAKGVRVQAVLPAIGGGAVWDQDGGFVEQMPDGQAVNSNQIIDAALEGLTPCERQAGETESERVWNAWRASRRARGARSHAG